MATEHDELIKRFNNFVSGLDISQKDKLTLLVLLTEIGYEFKKTADAIEEPQKRKHGEWKELTRYGMTSQRAICECSVCGGNTWVYDDKKRRFKYCPNCGADMDGDSDV